ncbi:MAG: glycosyltransferase [Planctomycetes bacterium]|nr:glycosyltransferase [Planctomycetota bacterium]
MPIQIIRQKNNPLVSIIIPSLDGYRAGNVPKLIQGLNDQAFQDFELLMVTGEKPSSRARNLGVQSAQGEIVVFFDDDVTLGDDKVVENLITPLVKQSSITNRQSPIGITGASTLIPPDANRFQRQCTEEFSRFQFPVVSEIVETDMAHQAGLAIKKNVYIKIGQENEDLFFGTDPDLRYRVRQAGYKVVVVPHTWVYHPPPLNIRELLKGVFQRGKNAAYVFWHYPHLVYETPAGEVKNFIPKRTLLYRTIRFVIQNIDAFINLRLIFLSARITYGLGYIIGLAKQLTRGEFFPQRPAGEASKQQIQD